MIDDDLFASAARKHRPSLAISYYPEIDLSTIPNAYENEGSENRSQYAIDSFNRLGAHSDVGLATFLINDMPGFQVEMGGHWYDIPFTRLDDENKEPTLIVMVGEMLRRWTNGQYRACIHRVKIVPDAK